MKSVYKIFFAGLYSLFLVACGGGGNITDDGTDTPIDTASVITVTLSISNTDISASTPASVTAKVVDSKLGALVGELVTFSLNNTSLGSFIPATATALTNNEGVATITLNTATLAGAGTVTGTIDSGESGKVGFNMKGDGSPAGSSVQVSLALTDASGAPIENITTTKPGVLTATVIGLTKTAIVTFESTSGDLPVKTAITDPSGKASVNLYAGSSLDAGTVTASLTTGESDALVFGIGATNVVMGSGSPFVAGKADVSVTTLSAGGTATVSVQLQDSEGNLFTDPVDVNFSSTCTSSTTPKAILSKLVTAISGKASSTYLAQGCDIDDTITVTATVGGKTLSATGSIKVLPANVGSIVFVDADPEIIGIRGTGNAESSIIRFQVLDTNGNPVANKSVSFQLNNQAAGMTLMPSPAVAISDIQGYVKAVVNSGTVATTVRVTATTQGIDGTSISSQSNTLVVSTARPDQDSFSLSASMLNVEGWNYDGATVTITARLADAFNNPVPDGTAVTFTAEGGSIDSSCKTTKGVCSVVWTSQLPRPIGSNIGFFDQDGKQVVDPIAKLKEEKNLNGDTYYGNHFGQPYGGRVTILATAIGEESFPDLNSNNILDSKKEFDLFKTITGTDGNITDCGRDNSGDCYDLSEAFVDHNEDGLYTPNYNIQDDATDDKKLQKSSGERETYVDFVDSSFPSGEEAFNVADIAYNGVLCDSSASGVTCSDQKSISVRRSLVLVMSGSEAVATRPINVLVNDVPGHSQIDMVAKGTSKIKFTIADLNNQQMPVGTKVEIKATAASVTNSASYIWPNSNYNGGREFVVDLKAGDQTDTGNLIVTVTTPGFNGIEGTTTEVLNMPIVVTKVATP